MPDKVKCCECGYLADYDERNPNSPALEATDLARQRGVGYRGAYISSAQYPSYFAIKNSPAYHGTGKTHEKAAAAIKTDIRCDCWKRWQHGKSPKEHEEMGFLEQVRAESARFNSRQIFWTAVSAIAAILSMAVAIGALVVSVIALKK